MKQAKMLLYAVLLGLIGVRADGAVRNVYATGFDTPDGVKGWKWKDDGIWKIEKGVGVGGSSALVWSTDDASSYDVCSFEIPDVKAGRSYSAEFKLKIFEHKGSIIEGTICWKDGEKWLGGAGGCEVRLDTGRVKPDADGWYHMTVCTTPHLPPDADKALVQLYVKRGGTGRVAFDDVSVRLEGEKDISSVDGFLTSCYRNMAMDGDVRFVACTAIPREYWGEGKTIAELSYRSADGSDRKVKMDVPSDKYVEITLPVSDFPMGRTKVTVSAKGYDGKMFGTRSLVFERVAKLPERRVWIDEFGRTIVEGKPFFPVGMFWSIGTLETIPGAFERYATGPFNCMQNYDHTLDVKDLDRFWAKGIRLILGVKDVFAPIYPNVPYGGKKGKRNLYANPKKGVVLKSWEDEDRYLAEKANSLKDHPAFLGWYICDEFRSEFRERLKQHYDLIARLDPGHPVCASILADRNSAARFIDCMDVFWVDSYSIAKPSTQGGSFNITKPDFGEAWIAADKVRSAQESTYNLLRSWCVGQAFAHKWDHPARYVPNRELLRFPTFKELKSQCWQTVAVGANGLIFYSYSQLLNSPDSDCEKERNFRTACAVGKEFVDMSQIITLPPGPRVVKTPKRVRVRTWRDGDAAYALVCNTHPERRKGAVRIDGAWSSCGPVMGEGVKLDGGALKLDMEPLGVTIVRLGPVSK